MLMGQLRQRRDIDDLQKRVGRRFDPDESRLRRNDLFEPGNCRIIRVPSDEAPVFEYALEQPDRPAVEVGRGGHFIAGFQQRRKDGVGRGQPGSERQAALAPFNRGQARLQCGPRRIAAARVFVALVLAEPGLRVR